MIDSRLIRIIQGQFELEWKGIHGVTHWSRVRENGLRLADFTGANRRVIELFAFLHDSRRIDDGHDPGHGPQAAHFVRSLSGSAFEIEPPDLELLVTACHGHSDGLTSGDITVLTCWDADRLDLGRVGIKPQADMLCTPAARNPEILEWAYQRSIKENRLRTYES